MPRTEDFQDISGTRDEVGDVEVIVTGQQSDGGNTEMEPFLSRNRLVGSGTTVKAHIHRKPKSCSVKSKESFLGKCMCAI